MNIAILRLTSGVKKSHVREPGTSKISIRTCIYFHPMSDGHVKKYSERLYFLNRPALFGNRTSKNLGELFLPLNLVMLTCL